MNKLESIIGWVAPGWAARRALAQLSVDKLNRLRAAYDGARRDGPLTGWRTASSSANAETEFALVDLRNRSRDLVRNNPYAAAGLDMLVSYQVGTGIVPRSATGDKAMDDQFDALWGEWARHADIAGRHDIYGLMAQAARQRAEGGECLAMLVPMPAAELQRRGGRVPLALQLLEPDHLDETKTEGLLNGAIVRQGVEMDRTGKPVAYHILAEHPGDPMGMVWRSGATRRISADYMLHVFRQDRAGQVRGVPDLAPVMTRLRVLDDYEAAALEQAVAQACVAAFVTSNAEPGKAPLEWDGDAYATYRNGEASKELSPGMIERLFPGEDVKFNSPSGSGGFSDFTRHQLRAVAAGFGLTYDLMTGDLTQANYSSLRAGRLAFKRRLEQTQWLVLIPRFCDPVKDAFVRAAQGAGLLPLRAGGWPVEWGPPRFEMVDPYKDAMAVQLMMRMGLKTWGQAVAEEGWDPRRQASELAEWNEQFDELGLILDGDPRRTAGSGSAQDTRVNSAIEIAATGAAGDGSGSAPAPPAAAAQPVVLNLQVDARAGTTSRRVDLARNPDGSLSARMTEEA